MLSSQQKHELLVMYADAYGLELFIESGTCDGDATAALADVVKRVISIEYDPSKYLHCWRRFINQRNVTVLHGDSGDVMESLLRFLDPQPTLFWLDGHWNEGFERASLNTPIVRELAHIAYHSPKQHVILIDDARLFGVEQDYPTVEWVVDFIYERVPSSYDFELRDDIMRFTPK